MEINERIKSKLESISEDYDSLKPFMQEYLEKIEFLITEKTTTQNEALQTLSGNVFSVSSISKELGCSRTTLYNHNQLLKRYIEHSVEVFNQNNPFLAFDNLKEYNRKLQKQINFMIDRDISVEIIKQEKEDLSRLVKEKNKEIERLLTRVNELSSELHQKMEETNKSNFSKILSIKK